MRDLPYTTPARWPDVRPSSFAATIRTDRHEGCGVALVGLPDDTGVKLNRGRPGAAEGPAAFRAALAGYGAPFDGARNRAIDVKVCDIGDVEPAAGGDEAALFETHARIEAVLANVHKAGLMPICIGGGHDLTLPAVTALSKHAGGAVGGVNFDAHLDVRTRVGSGMAFRKLIEAGHLDARAFVEIGLGRFANDEADLAWLLEQESHLVFADELVEPDVSVQMRTRGLAPALHGSAINGTGDVFVSLDLDAIDSSFAPGVSAINPSGLDLRHATALAQAAGAEERVKHFDIMELSPPNDVSGRTARLAAHLFLSFLAGFTERPR